MSRKRSILRSQTSSRSRRRNNVFRVVLYTVLGITIIAGLITLARLDVLAIDALSVHGNSVVAEKDISSIAEAGLQGNYFFVFPKHNKYLYPKSRIQKNILLSYPRIASVALSVKKNILTLEVRERQPHALWCKGDGSVQDECYFMDAVGFIFDRAPIFSGGTFVRFYGSIDGDPIGQRFDPALSLFDTENLLKSLELQQISISDIVTGPHEYVLLTKESRQLMINTSQDAAMTLDNLKVILREIDKAGTTWQSIDLRFGNKIYVKRTTE